MTPLESVSSRPARVLLVYYSRAGHVRRLGQAIAQELERSGIACDQEEILDVRPRNGLLGYIRSVWDSVFQLRTETQAASSRGFRDPSLYEMVLVGSPVWAGNLATPVGSYLSDTRGKISDFGFFLSYGGSGPGKTFERMEYLCGVGPVDRLAIREGDLGSSGAAQKIRNFCSRVVDRLKLNESVGVRKPAA